MHEGVHHIATTGSGNTPISNLTGATGPNGGKGALNSGELEGVLSALFARSQAPYRGLAQTSPYMQVGDVSDVSQINPRSQDLFQSAMGFEQLAQPGIPYRPGPGGVMRGRDAIPYRPESAAQGAATQLRALFAGDRPSWISGMAKEAADQASSIYSSGNALYSGAAHQNITETAYKAADEAMTGHVGALGNILQRGLNVGATVSQPEYFNPTYVQDPNYISPLQAWALSQGQDTQLLSAITGGLSSAASLANLGF